jgi:hypothetical protein
MVKKLQQKKTYIPGNQVEVVLYNAQDRVLITKRELLEM